VCFCKGVKGGNTKSLKKAIKGLLEGWGVSNKGVEAEDVKAVLEHKDRISYNSVIIKTRGLVKD
jgi:hypothetical protein